MCTLKRTSHCEMHVYMPYITSVKIIFKKINGDVGMATVPKTLETRCGYNNMQTMQGRQETKCLTIAIPYLKDAGIIMVTMVKHFVFLAIIPAYVRANAHVRTIPT